MSATREEDVDDLLQWAINRIENGHVEGVTSQFRAVLKARQQAAIREEETASQAGALAREYATILKAWATNTPNLLQSQRDALRAGAAALQPATPVATGELEDWRRLTRALAAAIARAREEVLDIEEPVAQRIADILWNIPTATIEEVDAGFPGPDGVIGQFRAAMAGIDAPAAHAAANRLCELLIEMAREHQTACRLAAESNASIINLLDRVRPPAHKEEQHG